MRVVLSWSGERSRTVARALWEWLPRVLYFVEPWMSERDIHAGERWQLEVAAALEEAGFGILCVTRESVTAPWLLYEAGALSRTPVVPLLIGIQAADITGPLAQFQAKTLDRQGCHDLVISINTRFGSLLERAELDRLFDERWPELAAALDVPRATRRNAATLPIPTEALRREVALARDASSLRHIAQEVGVTPMGLRAFILGEGTPQARTLRKLSDWYVRSASD